MMQHPIAFEQVGQWPITLLISISKITWPFDPTIVDVIRSGPWMAMHMDGVQTHASPHPPPPLFPPLTGFLCSNNLLAEKSKIPYVPRNQKDWGLVILIYVHLLWMLTHKG